MNEASPRGPHLRIVCVNDVYTLENLPRLRTLVKHYAETDPADAFITSLAGDFVAPSMLSSLDKGRGMVDCMNAVPITHVILGNHEDDIETDELRKRVGEFQGTWLNTNIPGFEPPLPAQQILEVAAKGGRRVRVGLLGVVMEDATVYRRKPFGGSPVEPANATAMREAARLMRDEHCACVIPLTHQTIADDRELASAQRTPPFPVIVGGHEHDVFIEQREGTWIVKAGADAVRAAIVDLVWPAQAPSDSSLDMPTVTVHLDPVANYAEDEALRTRVTLHMTAVHDLENATLMPLVGGQVLTSIGTRARQTSLGTLLCSRVREAFGAEGCIFNGGGIRGAHEYHRRFTYGDLKAELPFDNEIVTVLLPGSVVREAVSQSRANAPAESGGFLHVDDRITVDDHNVVTAIGGEPLDEKREYRIAVMRNLLLGMDHIEPLIRFGREHPEKLPPEGSGREIKLVLIDSFAAALWKQLGSFESLDADRDGRISADEVAAAVTRVTSQPASKITVDLLMKAADADHDSIVTREEVEAIGDRARITKVGEPRE